MSGRSAILAILAGLVALLVAAGSEAQPWAGPAGLEVRVSGREGGVAGAVVRLSYRSQALETGPSPVATDGKGRATLTGLAGGTWQVEIAHPDYMTFVAVVELAGDDKPEVTASFLEATESSTTSMKVRFGRARGPASPPLRLAEEPGPSVPPAVRPEAPAAPPIERPTADDAANPPDAGEPPAGPEPPPPPATPQPDEPPVPPPSPPEPPSREPEPPAEPEEPPAGEPAPPEPEEPVVPAPPEAEPEPEEPPAAEPAPIPGPEKPEAPEPAEPQETEPEPAEPPDSEPAPAPEPAESAPPETAPEPDEPPAPGPAPAPREPEVTVPPVAPPPAPVPPVEPTVAPAPLPPPVVAAPEVEAVRSYSRRTCVECRPGEWAVAARVVSAGGGGCSRGDLDALDAIMAAVADTDALELEAYAGPLEGARGLLDGETASALDAAVAGLPGGCAVAAVVLPRNARFSAFQYEASAGGSLAPCLPDQPCEGGAARWHGPPHLERGANATLAFGLFHSDAPTAGYLTVYFQAATPGWEPGGTQ